MKIFTRKLAASLLRCFSRHSRLGEELIGNPTSHEVRQQSDRSRKQAKSDRVNRPNSSLLTFPVDPAPNKQIHHQEVRPARCRHSRIAKHRCDACQHWVSERLSHFGVERAGEQIDTEFHRTVEKRSISSSGA